MNNPANEAALAGGPAKTVGHDTHHHEHDSHEEHELGFWSKYVFSTDHKIIGLQYMVTGLVFLFLGFLMVLLMRYQLAYPGKEIPFIGLWLQTIVGNAFMPGGVMAPDFYNSLGAMHGTVMIFLGVVPVQTNVPVHYPQLAQSDVPTVFCGHPTKNSHQSVPRAGEQDLLCGQKTAK